MKASSTLFALALLVSPTLAADLTKIDRTIRKEPDYQSKAPRYGLLVFGPNADKGVWLVLDGDVLHVDANGNGDITESGEQLKVKAGNQDPADFGEMDILNNGETKETLRFSLFNWFEYKKGNVDRAEPSFTVSWNGRWYGGWGDGDSPLIFSHRPEDAPILHVGGPLQMGFEVRLKNAFKRQSKDTFELKVGVGTRGLGKGAFTHLTYWEDAIPKDAKPTAHLEFPNKDPSGPPIRMQVVLQERC